MADSYLKVKDNNGTLSLVREEADGSFTDLQNAIDCLELIGAYGSHTDRTDGTNVHFQWVSSNKCIITGEATAPQTFNNIYGISSELKPGFVAGETYSIEINKSNTNIWLEFIIKVGSSVSYNQFYESGEFTIPENANGASLRLNTKGGYTYNNDYIEVFVRTAYSLKQATDEIKNNRSRVVVDKIGAMMNVAQTHFDEAYKPGSHLVYQQRHNSGIFYATPYYVYDGERWGEVEAYSGLPCTHCAQFVSTLMKGVRYENSRYISGADGKNQFSSWAWFSDDKYQIDYHTAGTIDDYMDSKEMADYANKHGFLYPMNTDKPNIGVGDVVLWNTSNPGPLESIADIGHCAMVVHVGMESKTIEIIESWPETKPDGSGVGIRTRTVDMSDIAYYAPFPFKEASHIINIIYESKTQITVTPDSNSAIWINDNSKLGKPKKGFYTFVLQGDFNNASLPYIRYQTDSTHLTPKHYFVRSGKSYLCTVYISEEIQSLYVNAIKIYYDLNESCVIDKIAIIKGYTDIEADLL